MGMTDFPVVWSNITTEISILSRPIILTNCRDTEGHHKLVSNNAILMHDDELSVATGIEMIMVIMIMNHDDNIIEACDTITNFKVQVSKSKDMIK